MGLDEGLGREDDRAKAVESMAVREKIPRYNREVTQDVVGRIG